MSAINKNFVIKKGLEVNSDLIVANSDTNRVGIGTNLPTYQFHVSSGIGATYAVITGYTTTGNLNILDNIVINGVAASIGQYIGYTTTGLSWLSAANFGGIRNSNFVTATPGQTFFNIVYEIGLLDVFVNGVKLSSSDYVAVDGTTVIFNIPCFGDEEVELIAYANVPTGIGVTGLPGINIKNNGIIIGDPLTTANVNFVGAAVTTDGTGVGVTVTIGYGSGDGGTITQSTSKSTSVTLNKDSGQITMNAAALAANTTVSFTLTNNRISSTDLLILNHVSGGTAGAYALNAQCSSGSASINVRNMTTGSLSQSIVIGFAIFRSSIS